MTKIYDALLPAQDAQTHAIIIGVSQYLHLPGGALAATQPAQIPLGLTQLTSPTVSAAEVTRWLLTRHRNTAAPLGTLELFLSPASYTPPDEVAAKIGAPPGAALGVEAAEFDPIRRGYKRWIDRVNLHRENVGIFYFCGHGLEASDRYLVPSDFGGDPNDPFFQLINISVTHGFRDQCQARTLCFFLDACRESPKQLKDVAAQFPVGNALIGYQHANRYPNDAPIFQGAVKGQQAAAPSGQSSYFTRALIDCLDGLGVRQVGSADCPVDQSSLATALQELINRTAEEVQQPLLCAVDSHANSGSVADLHLATGPVRVLTTLECKPSTAHGVVKMTIKDVNGLPTARPAPGAQPWKLTIPAGKCQIEAKFDQSAGYADQTFVELVAPPLFKPSLSVQQSASGGTGGGNP